ncbi:MAG: PPOX class F420-dependent oxidoreductase [Trebonia sp.]
MAVDGRAGPRSLTYMMHGPARNPARPRARPRPGKRLPLFRLADVLLPRLRPAAARYLADAPATGTFGAVARARHQLVVTFRRDGSPVPATVWAAPAQGRLYIRTERASGKVRRLRRDPRALVAPATARGRPLGPPLAVTGRVVEADGEAKAEQALASAHGWYRALFEAGADRLQADMCYLELTPRSLAVDAPQPDRGAT